MKRSRKIALTLGVIATLVGYAAHRRRPTTRTRRTLRQRLWDHWTAGLVPR